MHRRQRLIIELESRRALAGPESLALRQALPRDDFHAFVDDLGLDVDIVLAARSAVWGVTAVGDDVRAVDDVDAQRPYRAVEGVAVALEPLCVVFADPERAVAPTTRAALPPFVPLLARPAHVARMGARFAADDVELLPLRAAALGSENVPRTDSAPAALPLAPSVRDRKHWPSSSFRSLTIPFATTDPGAFFDSKLSVVRALDAAFVPAGSEAPVAPVAPLAPETTPALGGSAARTVTPVTAVGLGGAGSDTVDVPVGGATAATALRALEPDEEDHDTIRIGRFRLDECIGRGGSALVYKAFDTASEVAVALKVLRRSALESVTLERFLREAEAGRRVQSAYVVATEDVGFDDGYHWIATEYVDGLTLKDLMARGGPLPASLAARVACDILEGLAAVHAAGIVHRDLKPANVLLSRDGRAKICDFGVSFTSAQSHITKTGVALGTPAYMSPEQVAGEEPDRRSDLFSAGSLCYAMLVGEAPFAHNNLSTALLNVSQARYRPLLVASPDQPPLWELVIGKLLQAPPTATPPPTTSAPRSHRCSPASTTTPARSCGARCKTPRRCLRARPALRPPTTPTPTSKTPSCGAAQRPRATRSLARHRSNSKRAQPSPPSLRAASTKPRRR
jgi:serine/threonine protein kinase